MIVGENWVFINNVFTFDLKYDTINNIDFLELGEVDNDW